MVVCGDVLKERRFLVLPRQRVSVPLQRPDARHSRTVEPIRMQPELQVKIAVAPKVVCVPIFLPLGGVGSSPHEMTAVKGNREQNESRRTLKTTRTTVIYTPDKQKRTMSVYIFKKTPQEKGTKGKKENISRRNQFYNFRFNHFLQQKCYRNKCDCYI